MPLTLRKPYLQPGKQINRPMKGLSGASQDLRAFEGKHKWFPVDANLDDDISRGALLWRLTLTQLISPILGIYFLHSRTSPPACMHAHTTHTYTCTYTHMRAHTHMHIYTHSRAHKPFCEAWLSVSFYLLIYQLASCWKKGSAGCELLRRCCQQAPQFWDTCR